MSLAIQLHKVLLRKTRSRSVTFCIRQLIEEMNITEEQFYRAAYILENMSFITIDSTNAVVSLTLTGKLANIDY